MTASRALAAARGLSEDVCLNIDRLHEIIDEFTKLALRGLFTERFVFDTLKEYDYTLQELWEFPPDEEFHTLYENYKFKKDWVGRTFRCTVTGAEFTIPFTVYERAFYPIGKGFIDVGRYNMYHRSSGIVEITKEDNAKN